MKTSGLGIHRSRFYYTVNPIAPINHVLKARFDVLGSVLAVVILIAAVSLVRTLLSWAQ